MAIQCILSGTLAVENVYCSQGGNEAHGRDKRTATFEYSCNRPGGPRDQCCSQGAIGDEQCGLEPHRQYFLVRVNIS